MAPLKVAFLGPPGTYSHEAALKAFPQTTKTRSAPVRSEDHDKSYEYIPMLTIRSCMDAVIQNEADFGILPFENSTNGEVALTFDVFRDTYMNDIYHVPYSDLPLVIKCVKVKINHSLITKCERLEDITKVYSHPQVWGQCDLWYDGHLKGVERIDASSTSRAVSLANLEPGAAAIGGQAAAATVPGMRVLVPHISNNDTNTTRFMVVSRKQLLQDVVESSSQAQAEESPQYYSLVTFRIENTIPGALCKVLQVFGQRNINLTHIGSRPTAKEPWTYVFFIEFEGHLDDQKTVSALQDLDQLCTKVATLGSFKITN